MPEYTNYNEYLENMGLVLKEGASILCLNSNADITRPGPYCEERKTLYHQLCWALRSIIIPDKRLE